MSPRIEPPRWAEWILLRLLPRGLSGEAVAGDLEEELQEPSHARRWYARQALRIALRVALARAWHRIGRAARVETLPEAMHGSVLRIGLDTLRRELRYAVRVLRRSPGSRSPR
ncbi:MAG: hypothetical protein ACREF4_20080 [Gammaproteobacteria bacterium]